MTTALHRRWPFYALLGAGAALALHQARSRPRLQNQAIGALHELRLQVNGQDMHARVAAAAGNAAGAMATPVVLVHGLGVSGAYFIPMAQQLSSEFDVYVPDLPGHGRSGTPAAAPDIPALAQALIDWMDCAGIVRARLVAHSMGCQVAVEAALRHPGRIERLVLIAPVTDPAARSALRQLGRLLVSSVFERPSLIPQVIKDYLRIGLRIVPEMRAMLAYPIEEKLPQLRVPAMLMRGERDAIVPQAWLDEAAVLLRAAPAVVLGRWSHAVHYSAAAGVTQAIRPFLVGEAPGMEQLAPPGRQGRLTCRPA